jgi:hypothetical protein
LTPSQAAEQSPGGRKAEFPFFLFVKKKLNKEEAVTGGKSIPLWHFVASLSSQVPFFPPNPIPHPSAAGLAHLKTVTSES